MNIKQTLTLAAAATLASPLALAHDGSETASVAAGLLHQLTGLDHLALLLIAGFGLSRLLKRRRRSAEKSSRSDARD
ncbi:HupE/UreJ family protein [Marinobacterium aestuariivivens]|uniref:HupE/UreJ family protein n=1 Tax=Marinobacterium aestuariivivens TaxID=1698799 RepID=A0ABW2A346_9GAMM